MDGLGGLSNWRWVFILEGILTIMIGVVAYFSISDFPDIASWLTDEERAFVTARVGMDKEPARAITFSDIIWFFTDIKRVLGGIMYFCELLLIDPSPCEPQKQPGDRLTCLPMQQLLFPSTVSKPSCLFLHTAF